MVVMFGAAIMAKAKPEFEQKVRPILVRHCFDCHGAEKQKGKLRLDTLSRDLLGDRRAAETWHDVRSALQLGEMPPDDEPELSAEDRRILLDWLKGLIEQANRARNGDGGRVVVRRLNRVEYQNTMRDLLGIDVSHTTDFPPDAVSEDGMTNNGSALQMTPIQLEYYLAAARKALDRVIVSGSEPRVFIHRFDQSTEKKWVNGIKGSNLVGGKEEFVVRMKKDYPDDGVFRVRLRVRGVVGKEDAPIPHMRLMVGYRPDTLQMRRVLSGRDLPDGEWREFEFFGHLANFPMPVRGQGKFPGLVVSVAADPGQVEVEWLEFHGPLFESWPPTTHKRILFESDLRDRDEMAYVREVVQRFLPRAWRRPVTQDEIGRLVGFFKTRRAESPSFEEAIRETLVLALVSPSFLFLLEPDSREVRPLDAYELAARLSYFLWSSMPDDDLTAVAANGALLDDETLRAQVRRMLVDPRASEFVVQFTNQWLDLEAAERVVIDKKFYREFDPEMVGDMKRETQEFFGEILRHNLSARNFLDSDFTMLNDRLARHYGIEGVRSREFQRVALRGEIGDRRGGLLTQAAILTGASSGQDSNVIKRAVFVRDRLLGDPPDPPPPNVPELETAKPDFARLPIRDQLAVHLKDELCADCHRGIDGWGHALEEYDAIGQWRSEVVRIPGGRKKISLPVDAQAKLPDGREVSGAAELKRYLLSHREEQFARALVERIATYGLGRTLGLEDEEILTSLTGEFIASELRLRDLVESFASSAMFRSK
ncbi:DUF1592 domain-containing protein [bacterium]|nr:DUF1592 domain-containing protein [bacterium]